MAGSQDIAVDGHGVAGGCRMVAGKSRMVAEGIRMVAGDSHTVQDWRLAVGSLVGVMKE